MIYHNIMKERATINFDKDILTILDKKKKLASRSAFLNDLLRKTFKEDL